jgi:BMFP domain-containing protein YqiC
MSDDPTLQPEQPEGQDPKSESARNAMNDLSNELREMGQQLEAAFRAALESERTKQLQRDLAGGIRELSTQIQSALRSVQSNPRVQQAEERGRQVFAQARESKVAQDLQETIVGGIAQLNDQLRKLVDRLENDSSAQASNSPTQQVPIEHEPATGETTRLDDEGKVGP